MRDKYAIDSHELSYHPQRVANWIKADNDIEQWDEKHKLKKIISSIFHSYSTIYNTKIYSDIFLENSAKRFN